jgi:hypothetical protein
MEGGREGGRARDEKRGRVKGAAGGRDIHKDR